MSLVSLITASPTSFPISLNSSIMGAKFALSDENNSLIVITGRPALNRSRLNFANKCHVRPEQWLCCPPHLSVLPWKHFMRWNNVGKLLPRYRLVFCWGLTKWEVVFPTCADNGRLSTTYRFKPSHTQLFKLPIVLYSVLLYLWWWLGGSLNKLILENTVYKVLHCKYFKAKYFVTNK